MRIINILMKLKIKRHLFLILFLFSTPPFVIAGMIDKEGMAPYEICGLCHNLNGISFTAKFPKLAGQKAAYIKKQFLEFNQEERINDGGQMVAITTEVDFSTLDAIADYFAALPPPPAVDPEVDDSVLAIGKSLYMDGKKNVPACVSCHGLADSNAPWIYAQHQRYIVKQLEDFKAGDRANDTKSEMRNIVAFLSEDEMIAVAAFVESIQPRLDL